MCPHFKIPHKTLMLLVNLFYSDSRQAAMSSLDQALLQILGQIPGKFSPYTVVLTAQQPSRVSVHVYMYKVHHCSIQ